MPPPDQSTKLLEARLQTMRLRIGIRLVTAPAHALPEDALDLGGQTVADLGTTIRRTMVRCRPGARVLSSRVS